MLCWSESTLKLQADALTLYLFREFTSMFMEPSKISQIEAQLIKKAVVMRLGGVPVSSSQSMFGQVNWKLPHEIWPTYQERPMYALCQINLDSLPFVPPCVRDLVYISVFVSNVAVGSGSANDSRWCLRAYRDFSRLVPMDIVETGSPIRTLSMEPDVVDDFPCWGDVDVTLPGEIASSYYDIFDNVEGFKIGGWPTTVGGCLEWSAPSTEFVFQIDSTAVGNWVWGDGGIGYFGRNTKLLVSDWELKYLDY